MEKQTNDANNPQNEGINMLNSILQKIGEGIGGSLVFEYEKTKDSLKIRLDTKPK